MVTFGAFILLRILLLEPLKEEESTLLNFLAASGPMSREKNELQLRPGENTLDDTELLGALALVGLFGLLAFAKFGSVGLDAIAPCCSQTATTPPAVLLSVVAASGISEPDGDRFAVAAEKKTSSLKNWLALLAAFRSGGLLSAVVPWLNLRPIACAL